MNIEDLKQQINNLIDEWAANPAAAQGSPTGPVSPIITEPKKELPKDKRVVRTKTSGDRVYLLDEVKKTRQWITKPELVDALGFTLADVAEVDDATLFGYQMGAAIYRIDE